MQVLYNSVVQLLSTQGVSIITPVVKYRFMSLGVMFVDQVIPQFLKFLEGEMSNVGYWRLKLDGIEGDSQLIKFMNEFIEVIGKNTGQRRVTELLLVMGDVLGIGKKSKDAGVGRELEFFNGKVKNADMDRTNYSGGAYR